MIPKHLKYNPAEKLLAFFIRTIVHLNGGLSVRGLENIPEDRGVILASNHVSYIDPPVIAAVLPRRASFMARKGLFEIPILRHIIKRYAFPVDRSNLKPSTIKEAIYRIREGDIVVIFPEGRRSETGEMLKPKPGIGMIIKKTKAPVVPVLIRGAEKVLPVGARWLKRGHVNIIFGKPVYFDDDSMTYDEIGERVMDEIKALDEK